MPFSGKSEAVQIAKDISIPVVRMGDMVWDEVKKRGLKINDQNVGFIANKMREQYGKDVWAQRTIEKIKSLGKKERVVIDGIRNKEEIETFEKKLGKDFVLIAIIASHEIRLKRAFARGREDDSKNPNDVKERDKREIQWGLDTVIASADIIVPNEGTIEEFREKIKGILEEF